MNGYYKLVSKKGSQKHIFKVFDKVFLLHSIEDKTFEIELSFEHNLRLHANSLVVKCFSLSLTKAVNDLEWVPAEQATSCLKFSQGNVFAFSNDIESPKIKVLSFSTDATSNPKLLTFKFSLGIENNVNA